MSVPTFRVLIVDDNAAIHADFRKILCPGAGADPDLEAAEAGLFGGQQAVKTGPHLEIDSAKQGQEALEMVKQANEAGRPYALTFMDVRMPPGWDGVETTVKLWEVSPDLHVVICTAYSDYDLDEMTTRFLHSDRFVILKKPFDAVEAWQLANAFTRKWQLQIEENRRQQQMKQTVSLRTEELMKSEERYRVLFESSPVPAWVYERKSLRILAVNNAALHTYGYSHEEFLAKTVADLHLAGAVPASPETSAQPNGRRISARHEQHRKKDGVVMDVQVSAYPVNFQGWDAEMVMAEDITERKQAEAEAKLMEVQLRQAQKLEAVGQLAAGIAHEINTPTQYVGDNTRFLRDSFECIVRVLNSHKELIQAVQQDKVTPELAAQAQQTLGDSDLDYLFEQVPAAIKETLEGVDRVTRIVRAMKEFSHPGSKEKLPADLNQAIETTVTVARNEWKYVADLEMDLDPGLPMVPCFIGEFNQAILNLVVNAAHAIGGVIKQQPGTKGKIIVRTRREGEHVEVRVSDTGTGIPESARPHIFEPFFTTKDVGKGTGQGLSIIYGSIVKKHGGQISFETEMGRGTTFIIRLPVVARGTEAGTVKLPAPGPVQRAA